MLRIILIGAGGHGEVVADILRRSVEPTYQILGFIDEDMNLWGQSRIDIPILGGFEVLLSIEHDCVFASIGDNSARQRVLHELGESGETLGCAIHPSAILGRGADIGVGSVICAGAVIGVGVKLNQGVIINTASSVDHHSVVGSCAHIAPGVHTGGNVHIGDGALIGIGSSLIPGVTIGAWATVGAGSAIIEDVPSGVTVAGVPARPIRQ